MSSESIKYEVYIPQATAEQELALNGLAHTFGWNVRPIETATDDKCTILNNEELDIPHDLFVGPREIILKDDTDTIIDADTPEEAEIARKRLELINLSEQIVEPYHHIFDHKVPGVTHNSRTLVRRRVETGKEGTIQWEYQDLRPDNDSIIYTSLLRYVQGETSNHIETVSVDIRTEKEKEASYLYNQGITPTLVLHYEDDRIATLSLSWDEKGQKIFEKITAGTAFNEIVNRLGLKFHNWSGSVKLSVDINEALIRAEESGFVTNRPLVSEFRFARASNSSVKRHIMNIERWEFFNEWYHLKIPDDMLSKAEYLQIIEGMLSLLPTKKI